MKLSIVIGTYNRLSQLRRCVESIFEETQTPVSVFITDAGSTDGTIGYLEDLRGYEPRVTAILTGKKIGQARSLNQVFPLVTSELVGWLSDDNVVVHRGLDAAVEILRGHPKIGMVALKVKDAIGPHQEQHYIGGISPLGLLNVNQGVLRTPILHELGGFCEDYPDYGIDPDLTARVLFKGWTVVYTRVVSIRHFREVLGNNDSDAQSRSLQFTQRWLEIYRARFVRPGQRLPLSLRFKRDVFARLERWARKRGYDVDRGSFLGYNWRDWYNVFNSRLISVWDRLLCRNKPYHLVQRGKADPGLPLQVSPIQVSPIQVTPPQPQRDGKVAA